jgi:Ser/Thr protein kinase RdoA (MazF antagonist)
MPLDPHDLREALPLWPQLAGATGRLINYSENHTFLFDGPSGRYTLRVHRPDYQSLATIESELAWLDALRRDTDVPVPEAIAGVDGKLLQHFDTPTGERRNAVLFRFIAGNEPVMQDDLTGLFAKLGYYAAKLHLHSQRWQPSAPIVRQAWTAQSVLDPDGLWGDWRTAPGINPGNIVLIARGAEALRHDLAAYGTGADRYGLIHADMRLGNLLVDGNHVSLIDFDDSGFCWFTYDFAASVSFHETHPAVPQLKAAWLDAYGKVRPLEGADIASLDSMILLRRMALLAWMGTHAETSLAQKHMPGFADGTADLAERYLAGR